MSWPLLDSHCHLDAPAFDPARASVMHAARQAGVHGIVVPAYVAARWPALLALCDHSQQDHSQKHHSHQHHARHDPVRHDHAMSPAATMERASLPQLWPALGLHPVYIAQHSDDDLAALATQLAARPELVAVGEIGLDRFLPELIVPAVWAKQQQFFEAQLALAQAQGKPVIIHSRRAHAEVIRSLKRVGFSQGGVVHAFSGSVQEAMHYARAGLHVGLGGPLTYPQSTKLRAIATQVPLTHLLLETDAPDMVPWPYRDHHLDGRARAVGERVCNSPAYLPAVFDSLCQLRPEPPEVLARTLWANTQRALKLPALAFPSAHPA